MKTIALISLLIVVTISIVDCAPYVYRNRVYFDGPPNFSRYRRTPTKSTTPVKKPSTTDKDTTKVTETTTEARNLESIRSTNSDIVKNINGQNNQQNFGALGNLPQQTNPFNFIDLRKENKIEVGPPSPGGSSGVFSDKMNSRSSSPSLFNSPLPTNQNNPQWPTNPLSAGNNGILSSGGAGMALNPSNNIGMFSQTIDLPASGSGMAFNPFNNIRMLLQTFGVPGQGFSNLPGLHTNELNAQKLAAQVMPQNLQNSNSILFQNSVPSMANIIPVQAPTSAAGATLSSQPIIGTQILPSGQVLLAPIQQPTILTPVFSQQQSQQHQQPILISTVPQTVSNFLPILPSQARPIQGRYP